MLLGFGWQWTCDRFEPTATQLLEECFDPDVPRPRDADSVYTYRGCDDPTCQYAAVRGAPPVLGGPALSTRRFAFPPMRACNGLGFRWVATDDGVE